MAVTATNTLPVEERYEGACEYLFISDGVDPTTAQAGEDGVILGTTSIVPAGTASTPQTSTPKADTTYKLYWVCFTLVPIDGQPLAWGTAPPLPSPLFPGLPATHDAETVYTDQTPEPESYEPNCFGSVCLPG